MYEFKRLHTNNGKNIIKRVTVTVMKERRGIESNEDDHIRGEYWLS
jgi:hypothetical protein